MADKWVSIGHLWLQLLCRTRPCLNHFDVTSSQSWGTAKVVSRKFPGNSSLLLHPLFNPSEETWSLFPEPMILVPSLRGKAPWSFHLVLSSISMFMLLLLHICFFLTLCPSPAGMNVVRTLQPKLRRNTSFRSSGHVLEIILLGSSHDIYIGHAEKGHLWMQYYLRNLPNSWFPMLLLGSGHQSPYVLSSDWSQNKNPCTKWTKMQQNLTFQSYIISFRSSQAQASLKHFTSGFSRIQ